MEGATKRNAVHGTAVGGGVASYYYSSTDGGGC